MRYFIAMLMTLATTVACIALWHRASQPLLILPLFTTALISLAAGMGPATLSTLIFTALAVYLYLPPYQTFGIDLSSGRRSDEILQFFLFILLSIVLIFLGHHLNKLYQRLGSTNLEIQSARRHFNDLVDWLDHAVVWESNADLSLYSFVSKGSERIMKYDRSQWFREHFFFINKTFPEDRPILLRTIGEAIVQRTDKSCEHRIAQGDGELVWYRTGVHIDNESGSPIVRGLTVEINEIKEAQEQVRKREEELRLSEEHQRFLKESGAYLFSSLDFYETLYRVIQLAVPRLADWGFIALFNTKGQVSQTSTAHRDIRKGPLVDELASILTKQSANLEHVSHLLQTNRPLILNQVGDPKATPLCTSSRTLEILKSLGIHAYLCLPLDIRESDQGIVVLVSADANRKYEPVELARIQEYVRQGAIALENALLYQKAQKAVATREDLLAVVSHDLKNPLSAILMNAALIKKHLTDSGLTSSSIPKFINSIQRAGERMNDLIEDLLNLAKLEAGHMTVQKERVNAKKIIDDVSDLFEPFAHEKSIRIEKKVDKNNPEILCDSKQIHRVISNLVSNAIKFTPDGGRITISAEVSDSKMHFSVTDTGQGIQQQNLPFVFDRFWQAKSNSQRGTGLGLAIVKSLIKAHDGNIWVESEAGQGTSFHFTLPLAKEALAKSQEVA
ncbi:MAG: ATP-binding protein [Bdellovibrionota bacterium]